MTSPTFKEDVGTLRTNTIEPVGISGAILPVCTASGLMPIAGKPSNTRIPNPPKRDTKPVMLLRNLFKL